MMHTVSIWLLVAGFFGAGAFNAIGTASTRADFARWGYPTWWCRMTGGLEIVAAILIVLPAGSLAGLVLGAIIVTAAILTVVRHREFSHLAPLGAFAALIVAATV
jgi:membrane-bound metal-dependent hydrolase YbcI (DUF457 family)